MRSNDNLDRPISASLIAQIGQWIKATSSPHIQALSWIGWLAAVAVFTGWMLRYGPMPAKPIWIGLTIRTSVFAIWALIVREWVMLRVSYAHDRQPDRS